MDKEVSNVPEFVKGTSEQKKVEPDKTNVNLNKTSSVSQITPWWESKLTVALATGLIAIIIPATTIALNYFENENKKARLSQEYELEKARLEEKFLLETTESVIGKLIQPKLSDEAKLALYTFLKDISKKGSGTAKFANNMLGKASQKYYEELNNEAVALKEKQDVDAKYSLGDENDANQAKVVNIAKQETLQLEDRVKSIQELLVTYDLVVDESKLKEKKVINLWRDINEGRNYSIRGKLGINVSFDLYETKPSAFGNFGKLIGTVESGEPFIVENKYITFRGYKWLRIKIIESQTIGWYSWENIRSELVIETP